MERYEKMAKEEKGRTIIPKEYHFINYSSLPSSFSSLLGEKGGRGEAGEGGGEGWRELERVARFFFLNFVSLDVFIDYFFFFFLGKLMKEIHILKSNLRILRFFFSFLFFSFLFFSFLTKPYYYITKKTEKTTIGRNTFPTKRRKR